MQILSTEKQKISDLHFSIEKLYSIFHLLLSTYFKGTSISNLLLLLFFWGGGGYYLLKLNTYLTSKMKSKSIYAKP